MVPNVHVRTYRPRQMPSKAHREAQTPLEFSVPAGMGRMLAIMVGAALILGLGITQLIHGQMNLMQGGAETLRSANTRIGNENMRLLAVRAQLSSRMQIANLAGKKLQLFEPEQGQVRRM